MKTISTDEFRSLIEGALAEHRASLGDEIYQSMVRGMCDAFKDGMENAARICEEVNRTTGECPELATYCAEAIREAAKL